MWRRPSSRVRSIRVRSRTTRRSSSGCSLSSSSSKSRSGLRGCGIRCGSVRAPGRSGNGERGTSMDILRVEEIEALYDGAILALRGISLDVAEGSAVALLGANGAGKTTTLKAISNLLRAEVGEVTRGTIFYRGNDVTRADPADLIAQGLVHVLEGRHCFPHLTVEENLIMGAASRSVSRRALAAELERVYAVFPRLRDRRRSPAGYTSGGEQQMVAIGRALLARPILVLLDEPSMGLAPQVVEEIFEIVRSLNRRDG